MLVSNLIYPCSFRSIVESQRPGTVSQSGGYGSLLFARSMQRRLAVVIESYG